MKFFVLLTLLFSLQSFSSESFRVKVVVGPELQKLGGIKKVVLKNMYESGSYQFPLCARVNSDITDLSLVKRTFKYRESSRINSSKRSFSFEMKKDINKCDSTYLNTSFRISSRKYHDYDEEFLQFDFDNVVDVNLYRIPCSIRKSWVSGVRANKVTTVVCATTSGHADRSFKFNNDKKLTLYYYLNKGNN